jgi:pyruvate dehydrogenase E2 component (dihydrolipoamide acetyltransferase)/2-oxoisovalerate dehydrogenase E2 component (dihydrolipoyl transacylase)
MDFRLPELGEGVYEAELVVWLVKPGEAIKRGQSLMEVMTDKASMEVPSPFIGTVEALNAEPGQQVKVGEVVLSYAGDGANQAVTAASEARETIAVRPVTTRTNGQGAGQSASRTVRAAPSVRLMARQLGVDLGQVKGTGPGGRVLVKDLTAVLRPSEREVAKREELRFDVGTPGQRLKLHGLRRKIAEHMVHAKKTIPHYSYVDECEVTELVRLREALKEPMAAAGVKFTYLPFFVKAVVAALKEVPIVNASLDEAAGEIVLHDHYHIGIATATAQGLIVPVIHDADQKDITELARETERLSSATRAGKAKLDELRGSTFTVTSFGSIGGLMATPVINHPEAGIMAIGKIIKRPVYDKVGNLRPADMVYLSFSFDHRIVDGAVGAVFGNAVIRRLQNPAALLLK